MKWVLKNKSMANQKFVIGKDIISSNADGVLELSDEALVKAFERSGWEVVGGQEEAKKVVKEEKKEEKIEKVEEEDDKEKKRFERKRSRFVLQE